MTPTAHDIAVLLEEHRIGILSAWLEELFDLPEGRYGRHPAEEVRVWASGALTAAVAAVREGDPSAGAARPELVRQAAAVTDALSRRGFAIHEVIEGLALLRAAAMPFVEERHGGDRRALATGITLLDAGLRRLLGAFAAAFAEGMLQSIERAKARTTLMLEAAETAGSSLEPRHVFEKVAQGIATALRVPFCAVYECDEPQAIFLPRASVGNLPGTRLTQLLARPLRAAIDPLVREVTTPSPGPAICAGREPFLGEVTCRVLGIDSAVLLPIATAGRVLALALGVCESRRQAVTPERLEVAWGIARTVAPAVSNAHIYAATVQQLETSLSLRRITTALLERRGLDEVLRTICTEAMRLSGAGGCAIMQRAPEGTRVIARAGSTEGQPALSLPLRAGTGVIGALVLTGGPRGLDLGDERRMQLFADQGAIAIEHARLSAEHERLVVLEERQKLARDLHDSVSQSLYGLTMYAEAAARLLKSGRPEQAAGHVLQLAETSLDALREMRLLIFELRPPALEQGGLSGALRARLAGVEERAGLQVEADLDEPGRLLPGAEDALHGVAREALNNVLKHAGATRVAVRLRRNGRELMLEVEDDGRGFDPAAAQRAGGLGLRGMAERAAAAGAALEIDSAPGQGTRIRVRCPVGDGEGQA